MGFLRRLTFFSFWWDFLKIVNFLLFVYRMVHIINRFITLVSFDWYFLQNIFVSHVIIYFQFSKNKTGYYKKQKLGTVKKIIVYI